jgi:hypothetical protein
MRANSKACAAVEDSIALLNKDLRQKNSRRQQDTAIPLRYLQHASDGRFSPEPLALARTQEWGLLK